MAALDWLGKLGLSGFKELIRDIVRDELKPFENRFAALESEMRAVRDSINTLASVEQRLGVTDRVAVLEKEVAQLKLKVKA